MTRSVWAWVKLLGGLAILGALVWRLGTGAFLDGLAVIDGGTLLAAVGIGLLTTVLSAWRWHLVARGLGIRLPLRAAVADYYRAIFLNAALPGGILGDVHRAVHNGRVTGDMGRGVRAVVLERSAGTAVFVVVCLSVLFAVPSPIVPRNQLVQVAAAVVLAVAVTVALVAWGRLRRGTSLVTRALGTAANDIRRGLLARQVWPGILVSSTVVLAGHLATFLVAARAAGSTASFARLAPLMLLAMLAMLVPLNVGGWGPREGVTAWAFGAAGLSPSLGLTVAVVYGVLAFAASLPGAVVLVTRWLRPATEPASDKPTSAAVGDKPARPAVGGKPASAAAGGKPARPAVGDELASPAPRVAGDKPAYATPRVAGEPLPVRGPALSVAG